MSRSIPVTYGRILEKFLTLVDTDAPPDQCWEWKNKNLLHGYGNLQLGSKKGPNYYRELAHRFSYRHFNKCEIPEGMQICHKCDNPRCCNPHHLFLGTAKDNAQDAIRKGRWGTPEDLSRRAAKSMATHPRRTNIFGQFIGPNDDPNIRKKMCSYGEDHRKAVKAAIPRGSKHYSTKLTEDDVKEICELRAKGLFYSEIAAIFNMETTSIWKIAKQKRWKHVFEELH